jgi:acyl-coenzyme A thioesterase PaaI-like protein
MGDEEHKLEFNPPAGWKPVGFPRAFGAGRSFVSGETEGDRLIVHYFESIQDAVLHALVWFGPGAEGPPGHAHGGSMAAVLDEGMGFSAWHAGHPVVAATITVNFRNRLPLGVVHGVECSVRQVDGRKVYTDGRIYSLADGSRFADAEGLFIIQPLASFGALSASFGGDQ